MGQYVSVCLVLPAYMLRSFFRAEPNALPLVRQSIPQHLSLFLTIQLHSFPKTWPVFIPSAKVRFSHLFQLQPPDTSLTQFANWLEFYAEAQDINVWTSTSATRAVRDETTGQWSVTVVRADGSERIVQVKHIILAFGYPFKYPTFPGQVCRNLIHASLTMADIVAGRVPRTSHSLGRFPFREGSGWKESCCHRGVFVRCVVVQSDLGCSAYPRLPSSRRRFRLCRSRNRYGLYPSRFTHPLIQLLLRRDHVPAELHLRHVDQPWHDARVALFVFISSI